MQGVGFEPTRITTEDLKSSPLDHSGTLANYAQITNRTIYIPTNLIMPRYTNKLLNVRAIFSIEAYN